MAITNLGNLAAKLTGGESGNPQHPYFWFEHRIGASSTVQTVANRIRSLWIHNKSNGAVGAAVGSTAMTVCSSATAGALPFSASPSSGMYTYMLGMDVSIGATAAGNYMVYDRLLQNSGLVKNVATEQTCKNSSAENVLVSRYNSTVSTDLNWAGGNQIWLETYTTWGASAAINVNVKYINEAGTSGRVTPTVPQSSLATSPGSIQVIPLAAGDRGVLGIESVTMASSQTTAGNFGVTVARPLLSIPANQVGGAVTRDTLSGLPAMPRIEPAACLAFTLMSLGAGDPSGFIACHFVDA